MDYATLLVKRGELLRKIAKILFWVLVAGVVLFLLGAFLYTEGKITNDYRWGKYLTTDIKPDSLFRTFGYIGMGLGLLSPTVYFAALHFLGLGQIAKNTEK